MASFTSINEQHSARPDVARAVAYAAPVWALGLLFLIALIVLMGLGNFFSLESSALAIAFIAFVIIAAFEMMVRDLRRDSALCAETYRRVTLGHDVIVGMRDGDMRSARVLARAYALADMRQRAHLRASSTSVVWDDSQRKRRQQARRR